VPIFCGPIWIGSCSAVQRALLLRSWYFSGKQLATSHPDPVQERVADHLREYIEDLREEWQWDTTFKKTQSQLITAARRAKQEIAAGQAKPRTMTSYELSDPALVLDSLTLAYLDGDGRRGR
jgi:hypothetical protein